MIRQIAKTIAEWLLFAEAISAENKKLYEYGIYCFLFSMIPLGLVLLIGIPLGMAWEALLMIIPFMLIRKFCGGFHLKTPTSCSVASISVLTSFLFGEYAGRELLINPHVTHFYQSEYYHTNFA